MRRLLATSAIAAFLTLPPVVDSAIAATPDDKPAAGQKSVASDQTADQPKLPITISKETTRITEPLRKDGYVDYIAALNELASQGVTPDNNAAVLFWQAVGPRGPENIDDDYRDQLFKMLGVAVPPEEGDYFVSFNSYVKSEGQQGNDAAEIEAIDRQLEVAMTRPWAADECPLVDDWLKANAKPLEMIVAATQRSRRYEPLVADEQTLLLAVLLPGAQQQREFARALTARAMFRAHSGDLDAACEDLLACHRLARLAGQGLFLVDELIGIAIDAIAFSADQGLLDHPRLTAARALKMRGAIEKLPPLPAMAERVDPAERFMVLDSTAFLAREGLQELGNITGDLDLGTKFQGASRTLFQVAGKWVDWDKVLRSGNVWYDRLVEALQKPSRAERVQALTALDDEIKKLSEETPRLLKFAIFDPRRNFTQLVSNALIALMMPANLAVANAADSAQTRVDLIRLGFALAAYHADQGKYPAKFADLAPRYIAQVPRDQFADAEFHYLPSADGLVLYSVGRNERDDKGQTDNDAEGGDDLTVRVPARAKSAAAAQ